MGTYKEFFCPGCGGEYFRVAYTNEGSYFRLQCIVCREVLGNLGGLRQGGLSARIYEGVHAQAPSRKPKQGRPRIGQEALTLAAQKPWEAEGVSRMTWYRRRKERGE